MADYVDFKTVKAEVSVEDVASRYGVVLRKTNGSHERGKCPLPTHPPGDDAKSFSINVSKRVWICHSTACAKGRRGKKGGDVIELVAVMETCSLRDAGIKLASWFGVSMSNETDGVGESEFQEPDEPQTFEPGRYGKYHDLAQWVEERSQSTSISRFEQAAFLAVLGQIEELVRTERGGKS
ncbi:MAG: CHC2 zinc finger domain-containing protein [Pyrinomonadaceae bacterium]